MAARAARSPVTPIGDCARWPALRTCSRTRPFTRPLHAVSLRLYTREQSRFGVRLEVAESRACATCVRESARGVPQLQVRSSSQRRVAPSAHRSTADPSTHARRSRLPTMPARREPRIAISAARRFASRADDRSRRRIERVRLRCALPRAQSVSITLGIELKSPCARLRPRD